MKRQKDTTTTTTDTSTSEGVTTATETESSQDEGTEKQTSTTSHQPSIGPPSGSSRVVPVAITKVGTDDSSGENQTSEDQGETGTGSDSDLEIITISDSSDSPAVSQRRVMQKKKKAVVTKKGVVTKKAVAAPPAASSTSTKEDDKHDCTLIDLTVDSSDSDGVVMGTPPRRALHESPIKATAKAMETKPKESDDTVKEPMTQDAKKDGTVELKVSVKSSYF